MKRFVLPELMPAYALLVTGALIHLLENSGDTYAHFGVPALFAVGVWIVFRPQKFTAGARVVSRALLGGGRSKGSR